MTDASALVEVSSDTATVGISPGVPANTEPENSRHTLARRIGSSRTRLLLTVVIDATTGGAFLPLVVIYLGATTTLAMTTIGLLLTLGAAASLVVNPASGWLVDRIGARRALMVGNLAGAVGFALLIGPDGTVRITVAITAIQMAQRVFWTAWPVLVGEQQAPGESLDSWFALVNATRSASIGLGSAAAAVLLATGGSHDLQWLLLAAVVSSVLCSLLLRGGSWPNPHSTVPQPTTPRSDATRPPASGWRDVLSDQPFLIITISNTALTYAWLLLGVALPMYLVETVHLPVWLPSAALTLNTVIVVVAQRPLTARARRHRRTRTVALGTVFFTVGFILFATLDPVTGAATGIISAGVLLTSGVIVHAAGECLVGPAASAMVLTMSPPGLRGRYSAMFQTSWTVSTITGPAAIAALLHWSSLGGWSVMAAVIGLGGVGFLLCERHLPNRVLRSTTPSHHGHPV